MQIGFSTYKIHWVEIILILATLLMTMIMSALSVVTSFADLKIAIIPIGNQPSVRLTQSNTPSQLDFIEQQLGNEIDNRVAADNATRDMLNSADQRISVLEAESGLTRNLIWGLVAAIILQITLRFFQIVPKNANGTR